MPYFDITNDALFESMRKNSRHTELYRKHEDLRKNCERTIRSYDRYQKFFCAEIRIQKQKVEDRFQRLLKNYRGNKLNKETVYVKYSYNYCDHQLTRKAEGTQSLPVMNFNHNNMLCEIMYGEKESIPFNEDDSYDSSKRASFIDTWDESNQRRARPNSKTPVDDHHVEGSVRPHPLVKIKREVTWA